MAFRFVDATRLVAIGFTFLAAFAGGPALGEDWPCWRGPRHDGISRETGLLTQWPKDGPRQLWKVELSGGFSSVVVADGRLFTQTKEKNQEVVVCLDPATGRDLWRHRYDCDYTLHPTFTGGGRPRSRTGPRATPTVDGEQVYTVGATGILLCLEAKTGKQIWQQDLLKIAGRKCPSHGYNACPLVVGDRVYVQPGGPNWQIARRSGQARWEDRLASSGRPYRLRHANLGRGGRSPGRLLHGGRSGRRDPERWPSPVALSVDDPI